MNDEPTPEQLVGWLVELLTVEKTSDDHFQGRPQRGGIGRVFGGQVIAQALQAAQASVADGKQAHSLHAYFLRGGKEGPPIDYRVVTDFEGRSFANRRVVASQPDDDGNPVPILNLTASFQLPEEGLTHDDSPMPDVAMPEGLRSDMDLRHEIIEARGDRMSELQRKMMLRPRPIETRTTDKLHWMSSEPKPPRSHSWFRAVAALPDDPAMHRAVIAYASDFALLGTSTLPHGISWTREEVVGASLDHAIWFHRPPIEAFRADEWLLYATDSPWSGGGRGFNRGRIFNRAGELVASVAQEGMMRRRQASRD